MLVGREQGWVGAGRVELPQVDAAKGVARVRDFRSHHLSLR